MQVHKSQFHSIWTCAASVYCAEGLAASYVFYPTTLSIQFTVYKHIKEFANPQNEYSLQTCITAGGIASGVAAPSV